MASWRSWITRLSAKQLPVSSSLTGASISKPTAPDPIPDDMVGGSYTTVFYKEQTHCSRCGKLLIWELQKKGGSKESWEAELAYEKRLKEQYGTGYFRFMPMISFGPPYEEWRRYCPDYGKPDNVFPNFHDCWWQEKALYKAIRASYLTREEG